MNLPQMVVASLNRTWMFLDKALDGLTQEEIAWRPGTECNSIAFILWHLSRTEDIHIIRHLQGKTDIYEAEGWREKMGTPPNEDGWGYTLEQLEAWPVPELEDLWGYANSVRQKTLTYLDSFPEEQLSETFGPYGPDRVYLSGGDILVDVLVETAMHIGQIFYLRGELRGLSYRLI